MVHIAQTVPAMPEQKTALRQAMPEMARPDVSQAERLVRLALERFQIGRTDSDEPFAIVKGGPRIAIMFRGSRDALRATLARDYRQQEGITPHTAALADALTALQGEAQEKIPARFTCVSRNTMVASRLT